jgi:dihydrofolate reductase
LTRDAAYAPPGVITARSLDQALALARVREAVSRPVAETLGKEAATAAPAEAFIIGGAAVFAEALPRCHRVYLTLVHAEVEGDARFPLDRLDAFALEAEEAHPADDRHAYAFTFRTYLRNGS